MKKIVSIIIMGIMIGINVIEISYGQDVNIRQSIEDAVNQTVDNLTPQQKAEQLMKMCRDAGGSASYDFKTNECTCIKDNTKYACGSVPSGTEDITGNTTETPTSSMGISCSPEQLVNGQCKMSIYDTLGIRKSVRNDGDATSVGLFVQDIVLSATFFIGTLVTVALIVSGLMFIFAASSGKDPANAKKGMVGSLIGLLVVVSSYVIIRLVQYIAKGF